MANICVRLTSARVGRIGREWSKPVNMTTYSEGEYLVAVVNTNIAASIAQAALSKNERLLESAMEQLATGKRLIPHRTMRPVWQFLRE